MTLTEELAEAIDAHRTFFYSASVVLQLLTHKAVGQRGYTALVTVTEGWNLVHGTDGGTATLRIAESDTVTPTELSAVTAIALDTAVWKIVGVRYTAPAGDQIHVWSFTVEPTSESFS